MIPILIILQSEFLNFHWTNIHFVGPLIAPILDFVTLPMGFKVRVVLSLAVLLPCMQYTVHVKFAPFHTID